MKYATYMTRGCQVLLLVFGVLAGPMTWAQAPAPAWQGLVASNQAAGNTAGTDAMTTAANGDVYLVGSFGGTVSFGSIAINSSNGTLYVAKWSSTSRSFAWVQQAAGGFQFGKTIAVSGGSVYLTGTFMSNCTFGSQTLASAGARDVYVAKLTDLGTSANWAWAQRAGGTSDDMGRGLAVQGTNIYLAGSYYSSPATFGSLALASSGTNNLDGFVAKLTDAGSTSSFVWAQQVGGQGSEEVQSLAVNGTAIYLAGSYLGPAFSIGANSLPLSTSSNAFVAKLTDAGATSSFAWAQSANGPSEKFSNAVAVRGSNIYVAGTFRGQVATFGSTTLTPAGTNADVFVAKLTDAGSSGSFAWALRAGGTSPDVPAGLAVSGPNLYVAGAYGSAPADFGSSTLTSSGSSDLFVAKVVDGGNTASWAWAKTAGGSNGDGASALAISGSTVYVAGSVVPVASFNNQTVLSPTPQPGLQPNTVAFLASLTDPTLTASIPAVLLHEGISLFPNPAHNRATVQLPALPGTTTATLTILDALGRTLRTQTAATNAKAELDLAGLAPGLYAVRVATGAATATQRLMVE